MSAPSTPSGSGPSGTSPGSRAAATRCCGGSDAGQAIVEEQYAKGHGLQVGSTITAVSQSGAAARLTVIGEHRDPMIMNGVVVSDAVFKRLGAAADPAIFLAKARPGVSATTLKGDVSRALRGFPTQTVRTETDYDAS